MKWVRNGTVRVLKPKWIEGKWFDLWEQTLRLGKVEAREHHWEPLYLAIKPEWAEAHWKAEQVRQFDLRDWMDGNLRPEKSSAELTKELMTSHPDRGGDVELFKSLSNERDNAKRYESRVAEVQR